MKKILFLSVFMALPFLSFAQAVEQGVPITNYGIAIAALTGVLDRVVY